MDPTQILKISDKYKAILHSIGAHAQKCDTSLNVKTGYPCTFDHCLWMCGEIEHQIRVGDREKAMRWVCFIQGVLWASGILSVDSMREDNRSAVGNSS
jgi:hypothetical protein